MDVFGVNLALRYQNPGAAMHDPRESNASASGNPPRFELSHTHPPEAAPLAQRPPAYSIFAQFQARYPAGSLTAELLDIRGNQYIVRASIQVGGNVLATGMAAADSIEVAEDRARLRALEVLGLQMPQAEPPQQTPSAYEVQVHLMTNHQSQAELTPPAPRLAGLPDYRDLRQLSGQPQRSFALSEQAPLEIPAVMPEQNSTVTGDLFSHSYPDSYTDIDIDTGAIAEPFVSSHPEAPAPARNGQNGKSGAKSRQKTSAPESVTSREPMDLSDVIAQTSVEIKRLGWTEVQGRTYLQKTYGKRSRQHLADDELLEFLDYLRSQPSPNESPF